MALACGSSLEALNKDCAMNMRLGVAEPGCGKSSAFDVAMGMTLNAVSMEEGKSIHVAECSKAALLKGERQLLLTLWGGRGYNIAFASKAHFELQKSGLCIGGFIQPDRMMEIIEEMKGSSDGLFDRFSFNGCYLTTPTMESMYPVSG
uniref:Uncharacterized protein n=1 Tax=Magallana gigas TaxID=29159 RepID=A0A8W8LM56_MAGGI